MSPVASQATYLVKLKDHRQVVERTMAFQFEKPKGLWGRTRPEEQSMTQPRPQVGRSIRDI